MILSAHFVNRVPFSLSFVLSHRLLASLLTVLPNSLDFLISPQCRLSVWPRERRHHVSGVPHLEAGAGDLLLISPRDVRDVAILDALILWRAFVADPVNGAVVASWRKTSRNRFSSGVSSFISWSSFRSSVRVHLQDFVRGPVGCVLGPGPRPQTHKLAAFLPPRSPGIRPTQRPGPPAALLKQAAQFGSTTDLQSLLELDPVALYGH